MKINHDLLNEFVFTILFLGFFSYQLWKLYLRNKNYDSEKSDKFPSTIGFLKLVLGYSGIVLVCLVKFILLTIKVFN